MKKFVLLIAALLVVIFGCGKQEAAAPTPPKHQSSEHHGHESEKHHDAAPAKGVTSIDVYANGATIHLLLAENGADEKSFVVSHTRSDDGGANWTTPVRADFGCAPPSAPHRGMDVQIAASGKNLIAVWQTAGTDDWGGGPMATALSSDGGKTWRAGGNPADDGLTTGHGFIDIAADVKGNFHLVWLDSRSGKQGLRYARTTDAGKTWEKNQTLDDETCECCWNSITTGADGCVCVLYRDKDPRDMALMLSRDSGTTWQRTGVVGKFDWKFDGCPHVGGNLACAKEKFHTVVWTGAEGKAGIYHLSSADASTWGAPRQFPKSAHHPDIAINSDGKIAVVWDEVSESKYVVWGSVSDDGEKWSEPRLLSAPNTNATHPRVVAMSQGFRVFWTEKSDESDSRWQSAALATSVITEALRARLMEADVADRIISKCVVCK